MLSNFALNGTIYNKSSFDNNKMMKGKSMENKVIKIREDVAHKLKKE
jgi:hypothetical protein